MAPDPPLTTNVFVPIAPPLTKVWVPAIGVAVEDSWRYEYVPAVTPVPDNRLAGYMRPLSYLQHPMYYNQYYYMSNVPYMQTYYRQYQTSRPQGGMYYQGRRGY